MKRLLTILFVVLSAGALRASTVNWAAAYTTAYENDVSAGSGQVSCYTAYFCSQAEAAAIFGGAATVSEVTAYLAAHYNDGKVAIASLDGSALTVRQYLPGQYEFRRNLSAPLDKTSGYIAVVFYDDGTGADSAFRTMSCDSVELAEYGNALFNDNAMASDGTVGAWTQPIPEPTSGLFLLVGLIFLSLRRRGSQGRTPVVE